MDSRSTASTEIDLTKTHDERPPHHRLHSHLEHKRQPTTYPHLQSDTSMFSGTKKHKQEEGDDSKYNMTWGECCRAMFCCGKK